MKKRVIDAGRAGFTLIEVLIVVAILAAIATFVLPDLIERADDGEPARFAADMAGIGSGIELFHLDLRSAFPGDLEDLVHEISTADHHLEGSAYQTGNINKWEGPYIKAAVPENNTETKSTAKVLGTAFGGTVLDSLTLYDASNDTHVTDCTGANPIWVTVVIEDLASTDFETANDVIDGEIETDGAGAGQSQVSGRLRFDDSGDPDATYYLAHPCRA